METIFARSENHYNSDTCQLGSEKPKGGSPAKGQSPANMRFFSPSGHPVCFGNKTSRLLLGIFVSREDVEMGINYEGGGGDE